MGTKLKTILYASDLGDNARAAFTAAVREAVAHEAQIIFLTVVEPANSTAEALLESYMPEGSVAEMRQHGIAKLKAVMEERISIICEEMLKEDIRPLLRPLARVEEGAAAETIISVADQVSADLIVMGTRARTHSALGRFFVGSTAQSVLQLTERPLMIIPLR